MIEVACTGCEFHAVDHWSGRSIDRRFELVRRPDCPVHSADPAQVARDRAFPVTLDGDSTDRITRTFQALGWRLAGAGYNLCEFASGNHWDFLVWNLTIAALLQRAADRSRIA